MHTSNRPVSTVESAHGRLLLPRPLICRGRLVKWKSNSRFRPDAETMQEEGGWRERVYVCTTHVRWRVPPPGHSSRSACAEAVHKRPKLGWARRHRWQLFASSSALSPAVARRHRKASQGDSGIESVRRRRLPMVRRGCVCGRGDVSSGFHCVWLPDLPANWVAPGGRPRLTSGYRGTSFPMGPPPSAPLFPTRICISPFPPHSGLPWFLAFCSSL